MALCLDFQPQDWVLVLHARLSRFANESVYPTSVFIARSLAGQRVVSSTRLECSDAWNVSSASRAVYQRDWQISSHMIDIEAKLSIGKYRSTR
jgi:hypothetical protein